MSELEKHRTELIVDAIIAELKALAARHGQSLAAVARSMGRSPSTVSNWFTGSSPFRLIDVLAFLDALGEPPEELSAVISRAVWESAAKSSGGFEVRVPAARDDRTGK